MKTKVMEVISYKKQTNKTKYVIEAALEYRPPLNISRNFFSEKKNKSRGFYSKKYSNFKKLIFHTDYYQMKVSSLLKASANNSSANIRLSKTQLFEIRQSGGFLVNFSAH